ANYGALKWAAGAGCLPQLLAVQLLRLRWCADRLGAKLAAQAEEGGGADPMALLAARQQLRGRGRQAELVAL
ncbi:hypothetical protein MNEG_8980, partial [Monoraphidium neglectum]